MRRRWIWIAPFALVGMAAFVALGGVIVRWLWNWLLPPLFGWPVIGFWQAVAMLALCRMLFGGLGLHGGGRSNARRRMAERWDRMTPEERDRFRSRMRGWFGRGAAGSAAPDA